MIIGIALILVALYLMRQPERPTSMEGRLVGRPAGFHPLPIQRAAVHETLQRERDRIDAYESRCYREHLARCARESQHQL